MMYFAQRTVYTQRTKFLKQFCNRGVRCFSKLRTGQSLGHLGSSGGRGAHTGGLLWAALPFKQSCEGGQPSLAQLQRRRWWQGAEGGNQPPGDRMPGFHLTGTRTQSRSGQPSEPRTLEQAGSGGARQSIRTQGVPGQGSAEEEKLETRLRGWGCSR